MYQPAEFSTTITGAIIAGATTFTLTSTTGLPTLGAGDFTTIRLDDGTGTAENVTVNVIAGAVITCTATSFAHSGSATAKGSVLNTYGLSQIKRDALAMGPETTVTTTTTGTLNRMHRCAPSAADITLTLPSGTNEGDMIAIRVVAGTTKFVTLAFATGSGIDSVTTGRMMWAGESAYLRWDSTTSGWTKVAGKTIPMRARMGINTAGSLTTGSVIFVPFNTSVLDNTGSMVNLGSNTIVIRRPGDYQISMIGGIQSVVTAAMTRLVVILNKNSSAINQCESGANACAIGTNPSFPLSVIETLIASDALAMSMFQVSGTTQTVSYSAATGCATNMSVVELPNW